MMRHLCIALGALATTAPLTLPTAVSHAEEQATEEKDGEAPSEEEIVATLEKLVFVPHDLGAPAVTDAGGVRAVTVLPKIELLAPEHMARSLSPAPTLYWHISKPTTGTLRFTLLADDLTTIDPLLEFELNGVDREGIYGVRLDDHGLTLENGQRYIWSIALSTDGTGYGSDLVAQTVMEHNQEPDLARALDDLTPADRAVRLAAEGYWYDAIDVLSDQIDAGGGRSWQAARGQLLNQAGLLQAARFDRQQAASF